MHAYDQRITPYAHFLITLALACPEGRGTGRVISYFRTAAGVSSLNDNGTIITLSGIRSQSNRRRITATSMKLDSNQNITNPTTEKESSSHSIHAAPTSASCASICAHIQNKKVPMLREKSPTSVVCVKYYSHQLLTLEDSVAKGRDPVASPHVGNKDTLKEYEEKSCIRFRFKQKYTSKTHKKTYRGNHVPHTLHS